MNTVNVVGVQFRRAGKIYHFTPGDWDLRIGDAVVVDTDRGPSLAEVATIKLLDADATQDQELKPIMRKASQKDIESIDKLKPDYVESFARGALNRHELKIRILKAEVQLGGNKVVIYFSAPGRVDFRELVKDLATGLMARVELKQVGARDEAKLVGGLGICGREFCCSSFLREFVPVSIKMAKNQNLALNPTKVSGGCGRLLCCLTYENDTYSELRRVMPGKGAKVRVTDDGSIATVIKSDLINQLVMISSEDGMVQTLPVNQIEVLTKDSKKHARSDRDHHDAERSTPRSEDQFAEAEIWGEDINLEDLGVAGGSGSSPADGVSVRGSSPRDTNRTHEQKQTASEQKSNRSGKRGRRRGRGGGKGGNKGGNSGANNGN